MVNVNNIILVLLPICISPLFSSLCKNGEIANIRKNTVNKNNTIYGINVLNDNTTFADPTMKNPVAADTIDIKLLVTLPLSPSAKGSPNILYLLNIPYITA